MKKLLILLSLPVVAHAATTVPVQLLNPTGSTSGQAIVSTGASSAPAWGSVTAGSLAPQAANTALANATGSSAAPSAVSIPSCSTTASALNWTTSSGFTCNTGISAFSLSGGAVNATTGQFTSLQGQTLTVTNSLTSGSSAIISSTSNTANGAALLFSGNGSNANKIVHVTNGTFAITNSAGTVDILQLTDAGAFSISGIINPTYPSGIKGNISGSNVSAGTVGEVISSNIPSASAVAISTGVAKTITSITLTAGDWDVWGMVCDKPAAGTVEQLIQGSISETTNTDATPPNGGAFTVLPFTAIASQATCAPVGMKQVNVSGSQTEFLVITSAFTVSTNAAYGFIGARRR